MAETAAPVQRADVDILEEIEDMICDYPPLVQDRHYYDVVVENGSATISGHTRTTITRRYLVDAVAHVDGITDVNADGFHSDADLRLQISRLIPSGVIANVRFGVVVLTGHLPVGATEKALVAAIGDIDGVRAVRAQFSN